MLLALRKQLEEGSDEGLTRMDIQDKLWEEVEMLSLTVDLMNDARTNNEKDSYHDLVLIYFE